LQRLAEIEREACELRAELYEGVATPKLDWRGVFDLLLVRCGDERLALRLELVDEVVRMVHLRDAAQGAEDLLGLLDFRGTPVPILDLRARLGWGATPIDLNTMVVVLAGSNRRLGVVIDEVIEVMMIDGSELQRVDDATTTRPGVEALLRDEETLVHVIQPFLLLRRSDIVATEAGAAEPSGGSSGAPISAAGQGSGNDKGRS